MVKLNIANLFQFHYGTIKRNNSGANNPLQMLFQFHYGTIKSITRLVFTTSLIYFNSTMVRLKVRNFFPALQGFSHFNSTMVRLKGSH